MATATTTSSPATAVTTALMVVALVLLALPVSTMAQSPVAAPTPSEPSVTMAPGPSTMAPGPSPDCFTVLLNMSDCLSFVEVGSNLTKPESACCPELAGLVESNPVCLCQLLGNPEKAGITIDVNKALKLPSACSISTPPVSVCAAVGVPVSVPTASEPAVSPSSPGAGRDGSGGRSIEASFMCFLASLATIISITFF